MAHGIISACLHNALVTWQSESAPVWGLHHMTKLCKSLGANSQYGSRGFQCVDCISFRGHLQESILVFTFIYFALFPQCLYRVYLPLSVHLISCCRLIFLPLCNPLAMPQCMHVNGLCPRLYQQNTYFGTAHQRYYSTLQHITVHPVLQHNCTLGTHYVTELPLTMISIQHKNMIGQQATHHTRTEMVATWTAASMKYVLYFWWAQR